MTPLELYVKAFPNARLNFFQMEMIEEEVKDDVIWKEAVRFWAGNNYRAESVFKVIEYYKQKLEDANRGRWQDVGRSEYKPDYKCASCFDTRKLTRPDPNGQYSFSLMEVDCECSVSH